MNESLLVVCTVFFVPGVAMLACLPPVRAASIEPIAALRRE
jgi:ABC-type lipoprotein release transport system permease subunit